MGSYVVLSAGDRTINLEKADSLRGLRNLGLVQILKKRSVPLRTVGRENLMNKNRFHSVLLMVSRKKGLQSVARDIK
jgi:hypothetical protein